LGCSPGLKVDGCTMGGSKQAFAWAVLRDAL
jgi:hypothetical protein